MARLNPEEFQEKHARRLKEALPDMQKGVEAVTESPTEKAAKAVDKYKANVIKAANDGKWAAGLKRVSLDDWKSKMIMKGIPRVSVGIDEAKDKTIAFAKVLLPHVDKGKDLIKGLPSVTLQDNIQRMVKFVTHMSTLKR